MKTLLMKGRVRLTLVEPQGELELMKCNCFKLRVENRVHLRLISDSGLVVGSKLFVVAFNLTNRRLSSRNSLADSSRIELKELWCCFLQVADQKLVRIEDVIAFRGEKLLL